MPSVATFVASGGTLKVAALSEDVKSDILKGLYEEVNALKEIIETFSHRKAICEGLIKVMTPPPGTDGASSSRQTQSGKPAAVNEGSDDEDEDDEVAMDDSDAEEIEDEDDDDSTGTPTF